MKSVAYALAAALLVLVAHPVAAQTPTPREGSWVVRDFRFHTGEVLPELRVHYVTLGNPDGEPVLLLHGTGGSAATYPGARFAAEMFGPGQPLDASRYFVVIPEAIGHGRSSKPSDGLRTKFTVAAEAASAGPRLPCWMVRRLSPQLLPPPQ